MAYKSKKYKVLYKGKNLAVSRAKRRKIYLSLAKKFDKLTSINVTFSVHLCRALKYSLECYIPHTLVLEVFPEFACFKPNEDDLKEEGIPEDCTAWWDIYRPESYKEKALVLLFCAEMCE